MDLYLAIDTDTGRVKAFIHIEDLEEFANKHQLAYDYFEIRDVCPISLSELKNPLTAISEL